MPSQNRYLFVSYARTDLERVEPLVEAVRRELAMRDLPVGIWIDVASLVPGERWDSAIEKALEESIGYLLFISPRYISSNSARMELEFIAKDPHRLVLPILLDKEVELPPMLSRRQWLDFSGDRTRIDIYKAAAEIVHAVSVNLTRSPSAPTAFERIETPAIAAVIAEQLRVPAEAPSTHEEEAMVFVVHGHDTTLLDTLERYLSSVSIQAVVLSRRDDIPQSLFQKFMSIAKQAKFAIVLFSADDYGASLKQYDAQNVGDRALQFRARQNVIMELGFFYGRLGWENVFVVYQPPDRVFPNFERPSDLDGVIFQSTSDTGWEKKLGERLSAAGLRLIQ